MIISQDIVESVHNAWIADQQHPLRDREKRAIPEMQKFGELVDLAFRTSLIPEEGIFIQGSIAWLSRDDFRNIELKKRRSSSLTLEFSEPVPCEPNVLAKLGKVSHRQSSSIAIDWINGAPKIWGIVYWAEASRILDDIPAAFLDLRHFPPDCPGVSIDGVGSLKITRGQSIIGRIEHGQFRPSIPTPLRLFDMGRFLYEFFGIKVNLQKKIVEKKEDEQLSTVLMHSLEFLISEIDRQGGGASLILVPDNSRNQASELMDAPWNCIGSLEIRDLIEKNLEYRTNTEPSVRLQHLPFRLKTEALLRERLRSLARMATIDGAVVISSKFEVIGFGAKLRAAKWTDNVVEVRESTAVGEIDVSKWGTRHNSTINFVGKIDGAIGFVASTDGPIRGFVKTTSTHILCWPDCRESMTN